MFLKLKNIKNGTHWLWEITSMLLNGKAEHIDTVKEKFELEFLPQSAYNSISSPRVLNSHLYFKQLPTDTINKQCKIVYIDRNPKDVAVSFYNHHKKITVYQYDGKWENYCYRFMRGLVDFGSWFDYVKNWENVIKQEKDYPVHLINYEDLKENGFEEVKKLAKFLGVEEDIQLFKSIYEVCQFDNLKKKKDEIEELDYWKNSTPGMYRKGIAGDWKNWFTVKQNEDFNQIYEDKMKDSNTKYQNF
ncbi:hypothetical protein KUTeg_013361 [Tegillarca granosa]|uniref:Sulfotransferase domain-containing protein n=1 Tax=Tegillarca granosa TaxID=220873 RepID=A0ABQ9EXX8_TEGGR|nr:hypothetical protein KUTeg_013361 [Tegillarca granosa]